MPVDDDGGAVVSAYDLQLAGMATAEWQQIRQVQEWQWVDHSKITWDKTSAVIDQLQSTHTYFFRVRAANDIGCGAWSDASEPIEPTPNAPPTPDAPSVVLDSKARTLELRWKRPVTDEGELPIVSYEVQQKKVRPIGQPWGRPHCSSICLSFIYHSCIHFICLFISCI